MLNFPAATPQDLKPSNDSHRGSTIAGTNCRALVPPSDRVRFGLGKACGIFPCAAASCRVFRSITASLRLLARWAKSRTQAFASDCFSATRAWTIEMVEESEDVEGLILFLFQTLGHRASKQKQAQLRKRKRFRCVWSCLLLLLALLVLIAHLKPT